MRPETPRSRRERGPKGRGVDDAALADVRALLGTRERRRDLLIEHLHLIQDKFGCLEARHLSALADEMRLSQAEVYEVASFYDHFDIVKEGEQKPAPVTIRVCESISCMLAGADELIAKLGAAVDPKQVRVVRAACVGRCAGAPAARVGNREGEMRFPGWTERATRAHANLTENLAPFAILVLVAHLSGQANDLTALGARIFFWARVAHFLVYTAGITGLRTVIFFVGVAAEILILVQILS